MWKGHQGYEVLNIVQVYDFGGGFLSHSGTGGNSEIAKIASDELADGIHEGGGKSKLEDGTFCLLSNRNK